jgi:ADP-ribose pyrophosphatase YjhB (NUDIX family)
VTGEPNRPGPARDRRSTDLPAGGGVPQWLEATINHCARCGGALQVRTVAGEERPRLVCRDCGSITYVNPRLVATTLPITETGEVILLRRGFEPGRGLWAQPGGFLEVDETPSEGAARETLEEIGLVVDIGDVVGLYARLEAAVIVLVYEARIIRGELRTTPEALEVRAFAPDQIPWPDIAFRTTWWALVDWLERRHPHVRPPERAEGT